MDRQGGLLDDIEALRPDAAGGVDLSAVAL
jgi:hypothetical protein